MVKIRDQFKNIPLAKKEVISSKSLIETAGYMSAEKRITAMINAGQRLSDYRKEMYDTDKSDVEPSIDPTRKPGYDMAEGTQALMSIKPKTVPVEPKTVPVEPKTAPVEPPK